MTAVQRWSGRETRALRQALRMSVRRFASHLGISERAVSKWEAGGTTPGAEMQAALDTVLRRFDAETLRRFTDGLAAGGSAGRTESVEGATDDEVDAVELARRVEASDVGPETLDRLERAVDELAVAYASTPPVDLLPRVRRHLSYVGGLVNGRKTVAQHRRLLTVGGWLSLLAATLHIDLLQRPAAAARIDTALRLAEHAGQPEIIAWCLETRAWAMVTDGDYLGAAELSRAAQSVAPAGGSAGIQAIAQEGRACARMRRGAETRDALDRLHRAAGTLPEPERPEHHYRYDPGKALSYTATTLAWVGDVAAVSYAREAVRRLDEAPNGLRRPRRIAAARLDLGLALVMSGAPDEAATVTVRALGSGRIVPSNRWRADEIVTRIERLGTAEAPALRDAFETYCPVGIVAAPNDR